MLLHILSSSPKLPITYVLKRKFISLSKDAYFLFYIPLMLIPYHRKPVVRNVFL